MTTADIGVLITVLGSLGTVLATVVGARRAGTKANLREVTGERDSLAGTIRGMRSEHDRFLSRIFRILAAARQYIMKLESEIPADRLAQINRPPELDWDVDAQP